MLLIADDSGMIWFIWSRVKTELEMQYTRMDAKST